MKNKKIGLVLKIFLFVGIFAAASSLYFFIAGGNNALDALGGASLGVLKNDSAIALKSWGGVFGDGDASGGTQQDNADEIDLGNESSTVSSSDSDADADSTSAPGSASELGSVSAPQNFSSGDDTGDSLPSSDTSLISGSDENTDDGNSTTDPSSVATTTKSKTTKAQVSLCAFGDPGADDASANSTSRGIILNEIAWMGSLPQGGETGAKASEREWIELKNISSSTVDASGWQVLDSLGNVKIILDAGTSIPAGGFYLIVRDDASLADGVQTDAGYSGALPNGGDKLAVFDANCGVSDFLDAASTGWPGGNNTTKQTLERDADPAEGWHTSASPGGTPRAENSMPIALAPVAVAAAAPTSVPAVLSSTISITSSSPTLPQDYLISVSMIGAGIGTVSSSPAGILCGFTCQASFGTGTKINFTETPADGSLFKGWSGACKGTGACSFSVSSSAEVVAEFEPVEIAPLPISMASSNDTSSSSVSTISVNHLVIAAIQIGGVSSSNDFVKIFNPTAAAIDISGWKLHKKSSTGTDYSLRTFPSGSSVAAGGYFVWANSLDGFSDSIGADASSTETLSADNSAALFDANGNTVDAVAWGTGVGQYVEGSAYPTDPIANQILMRKFSGGAIVDTDDNAADFAIQ